MTSFTHDGQQYMDCWVETTVRCKGGKNMDGMYILGHFLTYEDAKSAMDDLLSRHPKHIAFIMLLPDTAWNRNPANPGRM